MTSRVLITLLVTSLTCGAASLAADAPKARKEAGPAAAAGQGAPSSGLSEHVQVTATRAPESTDLLPASLTIVTREDLLRRGVRDLRGALAWLAGVGIAPGGDGGPASSVPEMWGLREFDAFLLTVDGIPWGGAFTPALSTLDFGDVERIEVLRGAAPVMYGATSFVGVINLIRRTPAEGGTSVRATGGSYGSGSLGVESGLPTWGALRSSVDAEASSQGFRDDRAGFDRGVVRWRGLRPAGKGLFHFSVGGIRQQQDPVSPRPRDGATLSPLVPVDTNNNPGGSHLDENRYSVDGTYERPLGSGEWAATLSVIRSNQEILRGFLTDLTAPVDNAHGFRQTIVTTDLYFDSHVSLAPARTLRVVAGVDHLHGSGRADGGDFDYTVGLDGSAAPGGDDLANEADAHITDRREFSGLYAQAFWTPATRWHFELGGRLNRTKESRRTHLVEFSTSTVTAGVDRRSVWRGGGTAGVTFTAFERAQNTVRLFADYRNTYKPAVVDFGLDVDPDILAPETGESYEAGIKSRMAGGRLDWELTGFQMDLKNIVVSQSVGGVPTLENAGAERLRGIEAGAAIRLHRDLQWRLGYSLHDARFRDYLTEFGGVPTQIAGNRLEMTARNMASTGVSYGRPSGWQGWTQVEWVGTRFLNKRNTAPAPAYTTWDAGVAYRFSDWEVRLDAWNISDQRPPVAESELGDAQYYLLPPRSVALGLRWHAR